MSDMAPLLRKLHSLSQYCRDDLQNASLEGAKEVNPEDIQAFSDAMQSASVAEGIHLRMVSFNHESIKAAHNAIQ